MRFSRTVVLLGLIACLLSAAVAAQAESATKKKASAVAAATIKGAGCVRAGVEAGCLMLKDSKTGTDYNLFFKDKKPDLDTAISFEGTKHDGPTICMQGTAVDVTKRKQIRMHCDKAKK